MVKDEFEDDFFVEAKYEVENISICDDVNESEASSKGQNSEFGKEDVSLQERPVISDSTPIIDRPLRKRKRSENTGNRNDLPPSPENSKNDTDHNTVEQNTSSIHSKGTIYSFPCTHCHIL